MGHASTPPQIPDITDEAGDSPSWLPQLGGALLIVAIAWILWSHQSDAPDTAPASDTVEAAAE